LIFKSKIEKILESDVAELTADVKKCKRRWAAKQCAFKFFNNVANQLEYDEHKPTKHLIFRVH
jgi:hypothetical protein